MRKADRIKPRITAAAVVTGAIAVAGGTLAASWAGVADATSAKPAASHMADPMHQTACNFSTLDNHNDPTFNQLLGINEGPYPVQAFESGFPLGSLRGHATIVYNPAAQTIAVTLTASGLSPGPHAVDISLGSCTNQGPELFSPKDFTADSHGKRQRPDSSHDRRDRRDAVHGLVLHRAPGRQQ